MGCRNISLLILRISHRQKINCKKVRRKENGSWARRSGWLKAVHTFFHLIFSSKAGWTWLIFLMVEKDCPPPVFPVFPRMGLGSDGTLTGGAAVAAHACCSDRHTEGGGFSTGVLPSRQ